MKCSRCGRITIALFRRADDSGVCFSCIFAAIEQAESASVNARLARYFARVADEADERHAGHVSPVAGCERCGR